MMRLRLVGLFILILPLTSCAQSTQIEYNELIFDDVINDNYNLNQRIVIADTLTNNVKSSSGDTTLVSSSLISFNVPTWWQEFPFENDELVPVEELYYGGHIINASTNEFITLRITSIASKQSMTAKSDEEYVGASMKLLNPLLSEEERMTWLQKQWGDYYEILNYDFINLSGKKILKYRYRYEELDDLIHETKFVTWNNRKLVAFYFTYSSSNKLKGDQNYMGLFSSIIASLNFGDAHENGTRTYPDGSMYFGEMINGNKHGQGTITWPDGQKYMGEFKDGNRHGQGTQTWPSGQNYVGEWKDDNLNGQGIFILSNGEIHDGEFKDGKKHGQGTHVWPSGIKYEGEYKDDKKHGKGIHLWPDGVKYDGEFKDGKKHGQGTQTYADGLKYEGEFKDNRKHGQGTQSWPSGEKYVGEWKDGNPHGQGTYTYPDGTKETGEWKDGEFIE